MDWELVAYLTLCNYILAWMVVEAHVFDPARAAIQRDTSFLRVGGVHLLECRTCVAFWISVGMSAATVNLAALLPVWAGSRLLSKMERPNY